MEIFRIAIPQYTVESSECYHRGLTGYLTKTGAADAAKFAVKAIESTKPKGAAPK
jgi:hypothetical protein